MLFRSFPRVCDLSCSDATFWVYHGLPGRNRIGEGLPTIRPQPCPSLPTTPLLDNFRGAAQTLSISSQKHRSNATQHGERVGWLTVSWCAQLPPARRRDDTVHAQIFHYLAVVIVAVSDRVHRPLETAFLHTGRSGYRLKHISFIDGSSRPMQR